MIASVCFRSVGYGDYENENLSVWWRLSIPKIDIYPPFVWLVAEIIEIREDGNFYANFSLLHARKSFYSSKFLHNFLCLFRNELPSFSKNVLMIRNKRPLKQFFSSVYISRKVYLANSAVVVIRKFKFLKKR